MPSRAADWLRQARRDLNHARNALADGDFEWACFAAQQAAEKSVKAVYEHLHGEGWGHSVGKLLKDLPAPHSPTPELIDRALRLDKHYIPTRYPNGFPTGAPGDYFTRPEAEQAIQDAEAVLAFCTAAVPGA